MVIDITNLNPCKSYYEYTIKNITLKINYIEILGTIEIVLFDFFGSLV